MNKMIDCVAFGGDCEEECCLYPCTSVIAYNKALDDFVETAKSRAIKLNWKGRVYLKAVGTKELEKIADRLKGGEIEW